MCLLYQVSLFFIDAQTLDATARITQMQFTADLQTTSSQAYKNLSASIVDEVGNIPCYEDYPDRMESI